MKPTRTTRNGRIAGIMLCGLLALTSVAQAAKGGKGGGGDKGGAKGGGDVTATRITFADEMGLAGNRISGDGFGPYEHQQDGVDAFIGTGSSEGNLFLWLAGAPGRGLWLDFGACHPDPTACTTPFPAGVDSASSFVVTPSEVRDGGLWGIAPGETIEAPAKLNYDFNGPDGPGFIFFNPGIKGKNPCRNRSMFVSITRPGTEAIWVVRADPPGAQAGSVLACATLQNGELSGQYEMPFEFTVEALGQ